MNIKTEISLGKGVCVLVQESVDEVKELVEHSAGKQIITLTLSNGEPVYLLRGHIAYFTKFWLEMMENEATEDLWSVFHASDEV